MFEPNEESPIGRFVVIEYNGLCYIANILDTVARTHKPKRVRIQYDIHLQGKVLMPGQYTIKCYADEED